MSEQGIVFVISGPSGSGKGTVVDIMRKKYPRIGVSVSATTRQPRPGEREGVSYYYKTREEFEELIRRGEVIEHTEYNGNYYGTLREEADRITQSGKDLILEIETDGCAQVKEQIGERCVTIMLVAPTFREIEERLRGRGTETDEAILNRLNKARGEVAKAEKYDYVVVNERGKTEECADLVMAIIEAEHMKSARRVHIFGDEFWK